MQVNPSNFRSCNISTPIRTYSTGNDSIIIKIPGHYYYICGFQGHCQAGQKVDIRVLKDNNDQSSITNLNSTVPDDDSSIEINLAPNDSIDGLMIPDSNTAYPVSSVWFFSNKFHPLLFFLGLYLTCMLY